MKIVAFPYHDWRKAQIEGLRWRDAHILEELAARPDIAQVLVVDRPVSLAERLYKRRSPFVTGDVLMARRHGTSTARVTQVASKIAVLDITVPDTVGPVLHGRAWWFEVFAQRSVLDLIEWARDAVLGADADAIAWTPTAASPISRLRPGRFVFDSLDNWLLHPQLKKLSALAAPAYADLLSRANATVVSAPRSRDVLAQWSDRIVIIPNGVSPEHFKDDGVRPTDLPAAPVIGYAGSMGPRIDVPLVVGVAGLLPDCSFVFVGQSLDKVTPRALAARPNVHVLGDRHYSVLPSYLRAFDIAWIPHTIGDGESGGDPIKMYEYWAADREVISTPIDGLDKWAGQLHLVHSAREAADVARGLLEGKIQPKAATVPPERTWSRIADHICTLLESPRQ